jgi:hypothetical protein
MQDDARLPSNQPLPLTLQLLRWHSIVLLSRPAWLALHSSDSGLLCSALSLQYLEDLDLQVPRLRHGNPL